MQKFNPTHIFHYSEENILDRMFPKGVPVTKGSTDSEGIIEWLADAEGNVAGYSTEGDDFVTEI